MKMITLKEAIKLSKMPNYITIDLRNRADFQKGHIEGAINMPNASLRMIESTGEKDKKWILYCSRGNYSHRLALYMEEKGYDVMPVIGGFKS